MLRYAIAAAVLVPATAVAQQPELRAAPGTVVGIVRDVSSGAPLNAEISLGSSRRRAIADANGRFEFHDVKAGEYLIVARRVGYSPASGKLAVPDSGVAVEIQMATLPRALPPIVTSASRGGLSGVIGDTAFKVLPGAEIEVLAGGKRTTADWAGQFYIDLKPGKHMLRVSNPGYASRLVSVTVPRDSGRHMQVWMTPSLRSASAEAAAAFDLEYRLNRRNPLYSGILSREDMEKTRRSLQAMAATVAVQPVPLDCDVVLSSYTNVDHSTGIRSGVVPLWALDKEDLEFVEVYSAKPARTTQRNIRGGVVQPMSVRPSRCPAMIAWLRR